MKRRGWWILAVVLALGRPGGSYAADAANPEAAAPKKGSGGRITAEKDVVDIGAVVRGQVATATFVL